jgi:hypothetical protein
MPKKVSKKCMEFPKQEAKMSAKVILKGKEPN